MAAARNSLIVMAFAALFLCGCSNNEPAAAPVGEVTTSKQGAEALKKSGGKSAPQAVPSVDD